MADAGRTLTAEDVAHYPAPGTNAPTGIGFSPSGRWVSYLWSTDHTLQRSLFVLDLDTGDTRRLLGGGGGVTEQNLTLEERLRRERARDLGQGVTSALWADEADRLLVPLPEGLHVLEPPEFEPRLVVDAEGGALLDPRLSPDGTRVAFVRDDEIHVADARAHAGAGRERALRQLTSGAREAGVTHGLAEFVAQEEMDRLRGYWWSPAGTTIAFTEVDDRHIPVYRIVHQGSDAVGEGAQEDHRYPFAGGDNARVRLGLVSADGGEVVWVDLGTEWEYLARVDWLDDHVLAAQVENREQTRLDVVAVDARTGTTKLLLREESDVWINLHDAFRPIDDGARFLWATERSGFRHLEIRASSDGAMERVLTAGDWMVTAVAGVTAEAVWFTGTRDSPLERHLYEVPLAGGEVRRVTDGGGTHAATVDGAHGRFVDLYSCLTSSPRASVRTLADGTEIQPLLPGDVVAEDPRLEGLELTPPDLTTVTTDHVVTLHVAIYRPAGEPPFPTVVSVYGGPHAQQVTNSWGVTAAMRRQWLRSLGFLVVVADNRGSAGRGLEFEGAIRWDLGEVEVRDQVAVVDALAKRGLVDRARVAINGWSYGGYMSALCLAKAPQVFKVAVAGAPVTGWDGYDSHYTERYLGLPSANPEGYARSSVMSHLEGLRDRWLLLVHGLIDENVHFRHTARLANALNKARIPYELLLLPDERHSPRAEADRVYMEERIRDYLLAHL